MSGLTVRAPRGPVRGVALVLHGGRSQSRAAVRAWQLAVLRMVPFAGALRRVGAPEGLVVARLQFRIRGWNGADSAPVADARQALDELAARYPGAPIAVVGHSMGGRAALYVAAHPAVRTVVALAPWIEPGDTEATVAGLVGCQVLILHGDRDRMTDPRASARYAEAAAGTAASVSCVRVAGDGHAMLRRARLWHALAAGFVVASLTGRVPVEPGRGGSTNELVGTLEDALAGRPVLVV